MPTSLRCRTLSVWCRPMQALFRCGLVLLRLEGLVSLVSSIPCGSYTLSTSFFAGFPELCGEMLDEEIPFRTVCSQVSHSALSDMGLWVGSHMLQLEASLMMAEQGLIYEYSRMLLGDTLL